MEITAITYTNGTKEILPGVQHLAQARDIATYSFLNLTELEVVRLSQAKAEDVQKILNELF